ncbi:hypothetical protein [Tetragenococcus koreensis]|nr:hypothetical protein [Tetragenococcus koreensis]
MSVPKVIFYSTSKNLTHTAEIDGTDEIEVVGYNEVIGVTLDED